MFAILDLSSYIDLRPDPDGVDWTLFLVASSKLNGQFTGPKDRRRRRRAPERP